MLPTELVPGDIVQLNPETCRAKGFACCLAVVDEQKAFGAQLWIHMVGKTLDEIGPDTYYRAKWEEMELTGGRVVWEAQ
jgi:hypothetical protein